MYHKVCSGTFHYAAKDELHNKGDEMTLIQDGFLARCTDTLHVFAANEKSFDVSCRRQLKNAICESFLAVQPRVK